MLEEYEQLMEMMTAQAEMYSPEWTNMNPSEPGLTILENLTLLHLVQKETAGLVTDEARLGLLKLAGFTPLPAENAVLLVGLVDGSSPVSLPKYQKFYVNDICFETDEAIEGMQGKLRGVYRMSENGFKEIRELEKGVPLNVRPYGNNPEEGDEIFFLFRELPQGTFIKVYLYVQIKENRRRNPFSEEEPIQFAKMQWSCRTESGYEEISFYDETEGFLRSGVIELQIERDKLVREKAGTKDGYMFCCRLLEAAYDIPPEVAAVYGPLFFLTQRDTQSFSHSFHGWEEIELFPVFPEEMYVSVYVKEPGKSGYIEYRESSFDDQRTEPGRYYEREEQADGRIRIRFKAEKYNYAPAAEDNAVIVICCSRQMMLHRNLGVLKGYEGQTFPCPPLGKADAGRLCLGVQCPGQPEYLFFSSEEKKQGQVAFSYDGEKNRIVIEDAGAYVGGKVFLAEYALSVGDAGNIRSGNVLTSWGGRPGIEVKNPVRGERGRNKEGAADVKRRFVQDMETPVIAVTALDYGWLAKRTPGLCIRKSTAYYDEKKKCVSVIVMPWTEDEFPRLSPLYKRQIQRYLDSRKLLTDRVSLREPAYISVDVYGSIGVRDRENWKLETVKKELKYALDDRKNQRAIGEPISFEQLTRCILACPGAGHILELKIVPEGVPFGELRPGADINIPKGAACYPGEIVIREE